MSPTTLVTGAAGALGSAVARHLHGLGHRVVLVEAAEARDRVQALAAELGEGALGAVVTDSWKAILQRAAEAFGPLTGVVLVAGGWQGGSPYHENGHADLGAMNQANLFSASGALKALLPGLVEQRAGSVVLVGSRAAERPWESAGAASYAASKAAAVALAQAIAAEVLEHNVRVNAVLPSTIDTEANRRAMPDADATRWVSTRSLAGVIAFLLSDEARDISGAALPVYGRA